MALTQERRRQIQDAIRALQGQVASRPELQSEINNLNAKLSQDTENPDLPQIGEGISVERLEDGTVVNRVGGEVQQQEIGEGISAERLEDGTIVNRVGGVVQDDGKTQIGEGLSVERLEDGTLVERRGGQIVSGGGSGVSQSEFNEAVAFGEQQESLKVGATETFQNQLAQLRAENTAFRASLNDELGISGFDELLQRLEDQQELLIDREDEENKNLLVDLANARKTGILDESEFEDKLGKIVSGKGRTVDSITGQPVVSETVEEAEEPGVKFEKTLTPEESDELIKGSGAFQLPKDVTRNEETGVLTYNNPDTGLTFIKSPDSPTLDLSNFTDDDWQNLDAMQLLQAEMKLGVADLDNREAIDDAFFRDTQKLMEQVYEQSFRFTTELLAAENERVAIEKQEAEDKLRFAEIQNKVDRANSIDDTYRAQAEVENYLKAKLSAFGAGKSTAALSIMSKNSLKFARVRSKINTQYDIEAQKIQALDITTQRAYANTIVKLNLEANQTLAKLATDTQGNLLNLMRQKLISDADRDKQRTNMQLGYIKGVKDIEASKAQAEADALKEARAWQKDQIQMAGWMEKQTGTIWNIDASGQLYDTGQESEDAKVARQKHEIALAKLRQSAAKGGSGARKDAETQQRIVEYIEAARESGEMTDQEIMNTLSVSGPLVGGGETGAKITRFAERYINTTSAPVPVDAEIPYSGLVNTLFGFDLPTAITKYEPAPFVIPREEEDPFDKLAAGISNIPNQTVGLFQQAAQENN